MSSDIQEASAVGFDSAGPAPIPIPIEAPSTSLTQHEQEKSPTVSEEDEEEVKTGSLKGQRRRSAQKQKSNEKHGKGLTEGDLEMEALPKNNLLLVMPASVHLALRIWFSS